MARLLDPNSTEKLSKVKDKKVLEFIDEMIQIANPSFVFVNTGSSEDLEHIRNKALEIGEELKLNKKKQTIHFDNHKDQARDKKNTKILVPKGKELQNINTIDREEGINEVTGLFKNIMMDRTMIIGFYSLGPSNSEFSMPSIQLTDSFYVAHSECILYRSGYEDFISRESIPYFFKFMHSAGKLDDRKTSINLDNRRVYIDPEGDMVYSVNTQYAGNTVGLKKLAMRLAINRASKENWLCEHMLLMGIKSDDNKTTYFSGAFPSLCGKTSTAMMEGETIVGDDIAYIRNIDGSARGANVEKGIFGIITGVNSKDDPLIWKALTGENEVIFSNILKTGNDDVFWKGKDGNEPEEGINYAGDWKKGNKDAADKELLLSHPNARFTISLSGLNNLDPNADAKEGVEISGFVYGGRDSDTSCPVGEAFDWDHGIITKGVALESETTAATLGKEGVRVINPMSNIDFLSVPMSEYINMNLKFGKNLKTVPKVFGVNYFLKDKDSNFFNTRDDKRVWYKWMEMRVNSKAKALVTPTEKIPVYEDLKALFKKVLDKEYTLSNYEAQFTLRINENLHKIERIKEYYTKLSDIPDVFFKVLDSQKERLIKCQKEHSSDYIKPSSFTEIA